VTSLYSDLYCCMVSYGIWGLGNMLQSDWTANSCSGTNPDPDIYSAFVMSPNLPLLLAEVELRPTRTNVHAVDCGWG